MSGYYAKKHDLGLLVVPGLYISISIISSFGEKHEGYASVCSWCWLLASKKPLLLCIHGLPYLVMKCYPNLQAKVYEACGSTVFVSKALTYCQYG